MAVGTVLAFAALLPADREIGEWAAEHRSPTSRVCASVAKRFGDGFEIAPVAAVLWLGASGDRAPRLARATRNAFEAWGLSEIGVQSGKYLVHRHRPTESESPYEFDGPKISGAHLSFPSGHSGTAWAFLPAYAMEYSDHPWLAGGLYALATATSLSRIHDSQHWSSDVVVAASLGWLANRVVRTWNRNREAGPALQPLVGEAKGLQLVWSL